MKRDAPSLAAADALRQMAGDLRQVFHAFAQRRQDRHDVETVVKVFAEPASRGLPGRGGWRRSSTSTSSACAAADASSSPSWSTRSGSLEGGEIRRSVEEQGAAVGQSKTALACAHGAREGTFLVAEQFGSSGFSGSDAG